MLLDGLERTTAFIMTDCLKHVSSSGTVRGERANCRPSDFEISNCSLYFARKSDCCQSRTSEEVENNENRKACHLYFGSILKDCCASHFQWMWCWKLNISISNWPLNCLDLSEEKIDIEEKISDPILTHIQN